MWNNDSLDVSQCQSVEVTNILNDVEALDNETTLSELADITTRISDVINSSAGPILPMDLQNTNEILNTVLRFIATSLTIIHTLIFTSLHSFAIEADGDPVNVSMVNLRF